ncbi:MerR-like DNA binding protein [Rhodovulum bhavnagarense]|uniref:MerR-like DNA binding protein n=1 Tax=Rhodovulum bhavnagarense TaxID=992286 RepID=A0A4R2RHS1_9RHOB|nr:MerR family transcriptional regulator [Rhodovulum bhavnagarense]TCP61989.1 MerR-like DNA binding protein [Rhodovulum bhavnagarense]
MQKSPDAFRTISEVSEWLDTPAHVLRFWESRFSQVKPVKRAGGRRYYRPADMQLLGGIKRLLHDEGLTIRGVQKILREEGVRAVANLSPQLPGDAAIKDSVEAGLPPLPAVRRSRAKQPDEDAPEAPMIEDVPQDDEDDQEDDNNVVPFGQPRTETDDADPGLPLFARDHPRNDITPPDAEIETTPLNDAPRVQHPAQNDAPPRSETSRKGGNEDSDDMHSGAGPIVETGEEDAHGSRLAGGHPITARPTQSSPASPDRAPPGDPPTVPSPAALRPGADLAADDPADDDPAFAPRSAPLRTLARSPEFHRALRQDSARTIDLVGRLRGLALRMDETHPR